MDNDFSIYHNPQQNTPNNQHESCHSQGHHLPQQDAYPQQREFHNQPQEFQPQDNYQQQREFHNQPMEFQPQDNYQQQREFHNQPQEFHPQDNYQQQQEFHNQPLEFQPQNNYQQHREFHNQPQDNYPQQWDFHNQPQEFQPQNNHQQQRDFHNQPQERPYYPDFVPHPPLMQRGDFFKLSEMKKIREEVLISAYLTYFCAACNLLLPLLQLSDALYSGPTHAIRTYVVVMITAILPLAILGIGVHLAQSRACAIILTIYAGLNIFFSIATKGHIYGILVIVAGCIAIKSTFDFHKAWSHYQATGFLIFN